MDKIVKLKCVKCGKEYGEDEVLYTCPDCGIDGILDVVYDYDIIRKDLTRESLKSDNNMSLWRYFPALPLNGKTGIQPLQVGWSPLYKTDKFCAEFGLKNLFIKDDSRNPTASLKDRASAVGVAKAIELGRKVVCAASSGNAACSLSGFSASAGIKTYVFVPSTAPEAKVAQLLIYGSTVFLVKDAYEVAVELCYEAAEKFGWYNRSCAINPYLVEGKKTVSYEICEQMNWEVPDIVTVAVGDGCTIAGVYKGFKECFELGLTRSIPKIIGIQASGANPVTRAYEKDTYNFDYKEAETVADSICVAVPRNGIKALNAIHESGAMMIDVTDEEILSAMKILARGVGVFGEPAGVTGFAGVLKLKELGLISGDGKIACIVTGSGLKDIKSAIRAAGEAYPIAPSISEIERVLQLEQGR